MASILPDEILNKLLCSVCKKYLSCGPTKIYRNGKLSCGRCCEDETTIANSLYEKVARFSLFPCVNRYEGCIKLLQYQDVTQHEKTCTGIKFPCPICPSEQSAEVSLLYLIDHYRTVHGEYFLKKPMFFIDPNKMSENIYLYCDNSNNCLFLIKAVCTRDMLFLNACVSGRKKVVQKFRLNNVLLEREPNQVLLCPSLQESHYQHFQLKIEEIIGEQNELIVCQFVCNILEKMAPVVVAVNLNSFGELTARERTYRQLPKLYLDSKIFPGDRKYRLSPCGSKLIDEADSKFVIKLKCDECDMYFWNIFFWRKITFDATTTQEFCDYGLYCSEITDDLICQMCYGSVHYKIFKPKIAPILNIRFSCRYNCGRLYPIWDLPLHEMECEFNLEKDPVEFVKKCFGKNTYNADDKFIIGNKIYSFKFDVEFYSFAIFGRNSKIPEPQDVESPERVIYLITDVGLKCKVYYKYEKGNLFVRVEHDYDKTKYLVMIKIYNPISKPRSQPAMLYGQKNFCSYNKSEIMFVDKCECLSVTTSTLLIEKEIEGIRYCVHIPPILISIKKKFQNALLHFS